VRAGLHWLAAVAAGILVFDGLDVLASSSDIFTRLPLGLWVPVISPLLAGVTAAWVAGQNAVLSVLAAAATVWGRVGVDLGIGALRGMHPPPEAGIVLILAYVVPWTLTALAGGGVVVLARWARAPRPG
jgi:hypothetical protein